MSRRGRDPTKKFLLSTRNSDVSVSSACHLSSSQLTAKKLTMIKCWYSTESRSARTNSICPEIIIIVVKQSKNYYALVNRIFKHVTYYVHTCMYVKRRGFRFGAAAPYQPSGRMAHSPHLNPPRPSSPIRTWDISLLHPVRHCQSTPSKSGDSEPEVRRTPSRHGDPIHPIGISEASTNLH
jgi:hypothetical protein